VNQQGSSPSLQDELRAGVAVPDREGDVQYLRPAQTPLCAGEQGPGWGRAVGETGAAFATTRIVYVNTDITMGNTGVRHAILAQLATKYGGLYTAQNIAIGSTHQHSTVVYVPLLHDKGLMD
jgi:hypothetical protein